RGWKPLPQKPKSRHGAGLSFCVEVTDIDSKAIDVMQGIFQQPFAICALRLDPQIRLPDVFV
ncbi:MAG: hypothetical protein QG552_1142, partial [Thermodesulfobacteriota bacterium]|nr:hypothetical protein [Thermodesulfobacteriota bacterium]